MNPAAELSALRAEEASLYRQHKSNLTVLQEKFAAYNQKHSPLLSLPPEIRNKIYAYAIGGYEISYLGKRMYTWPDCWTPNRRLDTGSVRQLFPLFSSSHQLYLEVSPLIFRLNFFCIEYLENLAMLFEKLGEKKVNMIETLVVDGLWQSKPDLTPLLRLQEHGSLRHIYFIWRLLSYQVERGIEKKRLLKRVRKILSESGGREVCVTFLHAEFMLKTYDIQGW